MIKPITTERFILTKMTAADGDKYFRLSNNENVMKYVTGYSLTREESDQMLQTFLDEYGNDTYLGRYLIEDKNENLIGAAKLDQVGSEIEIGYRILEEEWGKGVATEIAKGLIAFAKTTLNSRNVIAYVNVNNAASIRVLEKSGMMNVETIEDIDEVKYKFSCLPQKSNPVKNVFYTILDFFLIKP